MRERGKVIGSVGYLGAVPPWPGWVRSWTDLQTHNAEVFGPGTIHYPDTETTYHASARADLVQKMMGDWLLQLDTDHIYDPDLLQRLLHTADLHNIDVLCGFYQRKVHPFLPQIYAWVDDGKVQGEEMIRPIIKWTERWPVVQVGAAGAGCLFVRRSVFERIRTELGEGPFDPLPIRVTVDPATGRWSAKGAWSEDLSFFLRLRRLGIKAFCDTRIQYTHLRTVPVTPRDYDGEACSVGQRQEIVGYGAEGATK